MKKIKLSDILVKDSKTTVVKLNGRDKDVAKLIEETMQQQEAILKLKDVDRERLRMVVQF